MRLNNILYIHIPRTGGSTFERILGFTGHDDRPACGNRKWGSDRDTIMGWDSNCRMMLQHAKYHELIEHSFIEPENDLISVSIIRNPYYRAVSLYKYFGGPDKWHEFGDFLDFLERMGKGSYFYRPMVDYLSYDGQIAIDNLIRFEHYKSDMEQFSTVYDLGLDIKFDSEKHIQKNKTIDKEYYSKNNYKERVYSIYKDDFKEFGYIP
jgi:hypothetical protein